MGKRNATESLDQAAGAPATPQKRAKLDPDIKPAAVTETPPQTYTLTKNLVEDTVLLDLNLQKWRVGQPVGKGSFGEIFLASDDISRPVTDRNAKYVVKIEPHSNGPLFVEIHCLMNAAKVTDESPLPDGMPEYVASGSHLFRDEKYRFLILPRFKYDLHSVLKLHKRLDQKNLLVVASQILDILQHLHDNGYVHSDIKAENLMVGNPADHRRRRQLRDAAMSSISSASSTMTLATKASTAKMDDLQAAANRNGKFTAVEYSGSNPVRRCRFQSSLSHETSQVYNEFVSSHYLRPLRHINYNDDSEASSDAFAVNVGGGGGGSRKGSTAGIPDVYNSNSNISVMSNSSCSMASSSGISSGVGGGLGSGRGGGGGCGPVTLGRNQNGGRKGSKSTTNSKVSNGGEFSRATSTAPSSTRGKRTNNRFRIISDEEEDDQDDDEMENMHTESEEGDRIYLIDFGLASKYVDTNGIHRPFFMDERRAHDGTLEYTSRDAHLGAHARRSDLECLGYNLICWSQGNLPWRNEKLLQQPEEVHHMKEFFMSNVKETMKLCYGPQVPKYLSVYMEYVNRLMYTDRPDYDYCRSIFRNEFKRLGYNLKNEFHLDLQQFRQQGGSVKLEAGEQQQQQNKRGRRAAAVAQALPPPPVAAVVKEPQVNGVRPVRRNGRLNCSKIVEETADEVDGPKTPQCNEQLLAKFGLMVPSIKETSSKISPKNLRSKKAAPKKKRRKMSWEELLATDPEEIARQRIEKEFDEQDSNLELSVKYQGKPTYAIIELENKLNNTLTGGELDESQVNGTVTNGIDESFLEVSPIKGYTKPMMDIVRRRHSNLMRSLIVNQEEEENLEEDEGGLEAVNESISNGTPAKRSPMMETVGHAAVGKAMMTSPATPVTTATGTRRKPGLRPHVKPTSKSLFYHKNLLKQKLMDAQKQEKRRLVAPQMVASSSGSGTDEDDENSNSNSSSCDGDTVREKKRSSAGSGTRKRYEDDEDWSLDRAEPEIEEDNLEGDLEESEEEATGSDDEELLSDSGSGSEEMVEEESNSCDRDLGSKRNTRLKRWNGTAVGGQNGGVHIATSNRFTERGKGQRMLTRG